MERAPAGTPASVTMNSLALGEVNQNKQSVTINVELFGRETPVEIGFTEIKKM